MTTPEVIALMSATTVLLGIVHKIVVESGKRKIDILKEEAERRKWDWVFNVFMQIMIEDKDLLPKNNSLPYTNENESQESQTNTYKGMKWLILVVIVLIISVLVSSQTRGLGNNKSPKNIIPNVTEKAQEFNRLALEFMPSQPDSALYYSHLALELAKLIPDRKHITIAFQLIGSAHKELGNFEKAFAYLDSAFNIHRISMNMYPKVIEREEPLSIGCFQRSPNFKEITKNVRYSIFNSLERNFNSELDDFLTHHPNEKSHPRQKSKSETQSVYYKRGESPLAKPSTRLLCLNV